MIVYIVLEEVGAYQLDVYNLLGKRVYKQRGKGTGTQTFEWSLNLTSGIYVARLKQNKNYVTTKFIIIK